MARKVRLFVVEDHPMTAHALKMYLEANDYIVTIAENFDSAVKLAKSHSFDLLICDLSLPDGNGWDLMTTLSTRGPVRAIAFTASESDEDIARSEKAGFIEHLVKGCSAERLNETIQRVLKIKPKAGSPKPSSRRRRTGRR